MIRRLGKMIATANKRINNQKYGKLLAAVLPRVINSEREYERMLATIDRLGSKGEDNLSAEEAVLLDLVSTLVGNYEDEYYPIPDAPPNETLKFLMEQKGL